MAKEQERPTVAQLAEQLLELARRVEQLEAALDRLDRRRRGGAR